jgi:hypothetical protein
MAHENVPNPVAASVQFIVDIQNRPARITKNSIHALINQGFNQNSRSCVSHLLFIP